MIYSPNSKNPKLLSSYNTTIILEADYLKMYKSRMAFNLGFEINDDIMEGIKNNRTFVEVTFFVVEN